MSNLPKTEVQTIVFEKKKVFISKETEKLQEAVKSHKSSVSEMINNILLTVEEKKVTATILPTLVSIEDHMAREAGFVKDGVKLHTADGIKEYDNVNVATIHVRYSKQSLTTYVNELNGKFIIFDGQPDLLYHGKLEVKGELKDVILSHNHNRPATREEVKSTTNIIGLFSSAGQTKKFEYTALNRDLFGSDKEAEAFINLLSSGQIDFYKDHYKDASIPENTYSTLRGRASTVKSPSVAFNHLLRQQGKETKNATVGFIVDIPDTYMVNGKEVESPFKLNDGAAFILTDYLANQYNALYETAYKSMAFLSFTAQNRPNASVKEKSVGVNRQQMEQLILAFSTANGGAIHHFTRAQIAQDVKLKQDIMNCYHKGIHGRFKQFDCIIVTDEEGTPLPDFLVDGNTVKAAFDPLMESAYNEMLVAVKNPTNKGTASMQFLISCFAADPNYTIRMLTKHSRTQYQGKIAAIGDGSRGSDIVDYDMLASDSFHHNTVAKMAMPELELKDKAMYKEAVSDVKDAMNRMMDKNKYDGFDGGYYYANLDFARFFGHRALGDDEVYLPDYVRYFNKRMKKIVAMEALQVDNYNNCTDDEERAQIARSLKSLRREAELLNQGYIVMYRSPKMSIFEVAIRRVVDFPEMKERLENMAMTKGQQRACLSYYGNANYGTVTLSGGHVQNNLHSGQDWDMDGFSILFDYRFVVILSAQKQVALHVEFDVKQSNARSNAELFKAIDQDIII